MSRKRGSYSLVAGLAAQAAPYAKAYAAAQAERLIAAGARRASRYVKRRYGGSYPAGGGVGHNSLYTDGITYSDEIARMRTANDETGDLIISHKEYVQDVVGSTNAFNNTLFQINPGNTYLFPWLSQIALNYTEYEMVSLEFFFRSTLSDTTTTTNGQLGSIIMATNYSVSDPPYTNKTKMMEAYGDNCAKATLSQKHGVECDPVKNAGTNILLIGLDGLVPSGRDASLYNLANFQIATSNLASNVQCGELWVKYTVRLCKPRQYTALGLSLQYDQFYAPSLTFGSGQNPTATAPLPAAGATGSPNNNIKGKFFNGAIDFWTLKPVAVARLLTYQFPYGTVEGTYKINLKYVGTFTATANASVSWISYSSAVQGGNGVLSTDYPCFATLANTESTVAGTVTSLVSSTLPPLVTTAATQATFIADFDIVVTQPNQPQGPQKNATGLAFVAPQGVVLQLALPTELTLVAGGFFLTVAQVNPGQAASSYSTTI